MIETAAASHIIGVLLGERVQVRAIGGARLRPDSREAKGNKKTKSSHNTPSRETSGKELPHTGSTRKWRKDGPLIGAPIAAPSKPAEVPLTGGFDQQFL